MKEVKKILLVLILEMTALAVTNTPSREDRLRKIKQTACAFGGFLAGHLPAFLFGLCHGKGFRIFHKSGFLPLDSLPARLHKIFSVEIPEFILGLSYSPFSAQDPWNNFRNGGFILFIIAIVITAAFMRRRDFLIFSKKPPDFRPSCIPIFFLIAVFTLIANIASTLEAARYLAPLYLALVVILGFFIGESAWQKSKILAVLLGGLLAVHFFYNDYRYYKDIPQNRFKDLKRVLHYLDHEKIQGGVGPRSITHILTFLAGERIVFSTYQQEERYKPHADYTQKLWRKAYVFEADDSSAEKFRSSPIFRKEVVTTERFGNYVVYIAEDHRLKEQMPALPSYLDWRPKPHFHFYANQ